MNETVYVSSVQLYQRRSHESRYTSYVQLKCINMLSTITQISISLSVTWLQELKLKVTIALRVHVCKFYTRIKMAP